MPTAVPQGITQHYWNYSSGPLSSLKIRVTSFLRLGPGHSKEGRGEEANPPVPVLGHGLTGQAQDCALSWNITRLPSECTLCCSVMSDSLWPHGLYSPPGSPAHGIFQARILEQIAISYSRGSYWPRDWTCASCISSHLGSLLPTEDISLLIMIAYLTRCAREYYPKVRVIGWCWLMTSSP